MKTVCLSDLAESTLESCSVKMCPVKPLPAEKVEVFLLFEAYYIILLTSVQMCNFWYFMVIFPTSPLWVSDYEQSEVTFSQEYWVIFLSSDTLIFIGFYQRFLVSWET